MAQVKEFDMNCFDGQIMNHFIPYFEDFCLLAKYLYLALFPEDSKGHQANGQQ